MASGFVRARTSPAPDSARSTNTAENIKQLKLSWSFSTGTDRGQEAAPFVVGTTMYIVTPYPNIVYALA
jgi:glucose dehydrogenase